MNKGWYLFSFLLRALFLLVFSFCTSCKHEDFVLSGSNIGEEGTPVMVNLNFSKETFKTPSSEEFFETRNIVVDEENPFSLKLGKTSLDDSSSPLLTRASTGNTPLYNLWVFQFGADKKLRKITRVSTTTEPMNEGVDINVELFTGVNQTIYLLALGKQYTNVNFSGISDINDLEGFKYDFYRFEDGIAIARINKEEDIPYTGYQTGLEIIKPDNSNSGFIKSDPLSGFTGAIKMSALVTRVTFNFSYSALGFTPSFMTLNNLPSQFAINNIPTSFNSAISFDLSSVDLSGGKRVEYSWYMPSNPQGKVPSITKESERFFYTTTGGGTKGTAPRDATFINFWALDNDLVDNYALYYIFLGSNNTTDFNLHPNSHYIYRTDINTAVNDNNRVLLRKIAKTIDVASTGIVLPYFLLGNRTSIAYDLDAHSGMRPMEITALRGSVQIEVLNSTDGGTTLTPPPSYNSSWLKLSTYPNYTEALNAYKAGSKSGLSTSISLNASTPGLFKLYMYNDEYEQYTSKDPNTDALKRTMYIRITFHTGTGASEVRTFRISQRPAYYIGLFGGEHRNDDGSYSKGLVFESLREPKQYLSYYKGSYDMVLGSYNAQRTQLDDYDVENAVCGRKATVAISENNKNFSLLSQLNLKEPRWVNGAVDLYQYKYYTSDSFGVRACYDKNRDSNGNGEIDDEEIIWYLPSYFQNLSVNFNYYSDNHGPLSSTDLFSVTSTSFEFGRYSTTLFSDNNNNNSDIFNGCYTLYHHMPVIRNGTNNFSARSHERCVKDVSVPVDPSFATGPTVSEEDGFAVINATGFTSGAYENRVTLRLRSDNRFIRHKITDEIGQKISGRFRVAKEDLPRKMTWAEAGGLNTTLNDKPLEEDIQDTDPKNTGCYQLPLAKGTSHWRLPTASELVLIDMMDEIMEKTKPLTGYVGLNSVKGLKDEFYWSYTEVDKEHVYILLNAGNPDQKRAARYLKGDNHTFKSGFNGSEGRVRCIQDLDF